MYGLTVVLFSVLVFSGIGSMLVEHVIRADHPRSLLVPLGLLGLVVMAAGLVTPDVVRRWTARPPARMATSVALLAPLALVMGMPFAVGIVPPRPCPPRRPPSYGASTGPVRVCLGPGRRDRLFFGISAALWAGAVAYGLAAASMAVITARRAAPIIEIQQPEPELVAASDEAPTTNLPVPTT